MWLDYLYGHKQVGNVHIPYNTYSRVINNIIIVKYNRSQTPLRQSIYTLGTYTRFKYAEPDKPSHLLLRETGV